MCISPSLCLAQDLGARVCVDIFIKYYVHIYICIGEDWSRGTNACILHTGGSTTCSEEEENEKEAAVGAERAGSVC